VEKAEREKRGGETWGVARGGRIKHGKKQGLPGEKTVLIPGNRRKGEGR